MLDVLRKIFIEKYEFGIIELNDFEKSLEKVKIKKGKELIKPGQLFKNIYIVEKGLCMSYSFDEAGNKTVIDFFDEFWWVTDINSVYANKPSLYYIEVMEDMVAHSISIEDVNRLRKLHPKINNLFNKMLVDLALHLKERYIQRVTMTAEKRYKAFLDFYPTISLRVSQKLIASFLGVTPEFFSKMKSDMYKELKH